MAATSSARVGALTSLPWCVCSMLCNTCQVYLFVYLGFYVAFNTVQVISRRVVGRAEETST